MGTADLGGGYLSVVGVPTGHEEMAYGEFCSVLMPQSTMNNSGGLPYLRGRVEEEHSKTQSRCRNATKRKDTQEPQGETFWKWWLVHRGRLHGDQGEYGLANRNPDATDDVTNKQFQAEERMAFIKEIQEMLSQ